MIHPSIGNIGEEIYEAQRRAKFNPNRFLLTFNSNQPQSIRAKIANIGGEERVFLTMRPRISEVTPIATFCIDFIEEDIPTDRFLNPPVKTKRIRPANRDEYIAFIGWFPQIAHKRRLICLNTDLFFGDYYVSPVAYESKGDHFEARALPDEDRNLRAGDAVIFRIKVR